MKELVGKTILGISVNPIQSILAIETDQGNENYETYGGCCSETWFADITGVNALLGGTVISVEDMELPDNPDDRCRQEHDQFYGVKIITNKGYADIVYRNSSNGYYGGEIYGYKGEIPDDMTAITDDWSAGEAIYKDED